MSLPEEKLYDDDEKLEHFQLADDNEQLFAIIDSTARKMGLKGWADLPRVAEQAYQDVERLRKLHRLSQSRRVMKPVSSESFEEFRKRIDSLPG